MILYTYNDVNLHNTHNNRNFAVDVRETLMKCMQNLYKVRSTNYTT